MHTQSTNKYLKSSLWMFAILLLLPFTFRSPFLLADDKSINLSFAVYTSDKATTMYQKFSPIIGALTEELEARLECPVDIKIKIYKSYDGAINAISTGEVDFVRFGPAPYVLSKQKNSKIQLLAMESKKGKKVFKGAIVVLKDSPIKSMEDLRGHSFAFGDANSTIGRYLSQEALLGAGLKESDLRAIKYLGRHDKVVKAVRLGDFVAGAAKLSTVKKLNKDGKLRVLHSFDNVTKPWVARSGLPKNVLESLSKALLSLEDKAILKSMGVSGFLPCTDKDYEPIRVAIRKSKEFGSKRLKKSATEK